MRKLRNPLLTLAATGSILLTLTGCNTTDPSKYETVKMPPAMNYKYSSSTHIAQYSESTNQQQAPAVSIQPLQRQSNSYSSGKSSNTLSRAQIMSELKRDGVRILPTVNDYNYVVPDYNWIAKEYHGYFSWFLYYLGAKYNAEGMDCDNFANFYQQNLVLANLKAGGARHGDVPCARMVVNQKDRGIYHALNLIRTNLGWYVVEPQDGQLIALNDYRYRKNITKIVF